MRRSDHFMRLLRRSEQSPILGISLGFSGTSDHESGIEFEGGRVDSRGLRLYEFPESTYLVYWPGHFIPDAIEPNPPELDERGLRDHCLSERSRFARGVWNEPDLECAWARYGFVIRASGDRDAVTAFLKELYGAFCAGRGRACLHTLGFSSGPPWLLCVYVEPVEGGLVVSPASLCSPSRANE